MKYLAFSLSILFSISSCDQEEWNSSTTEDSDLVSNIALVRYGGPIAADGCGWLIEYNNKTYKAFELPEKWQIDSLYLNASFNVTGNDFFCFGPQGIPSVELAGDQSETLLQFYYSETQCSDPWTRRTDSDAGQAGELMTYLNDNDISVRALRIHKIQANFAFCAACNCGTGRSFSLWTNNESKEALEQLGFTQMTACTINNPLDKIEWLKDIKEQFEMIDDDIPKRIVQYEYNDQCVFSIDACLNCPDALTYVYDENKNIICEFGGIDGRNTCPDFSEKNKNPIELFSVN